MTPHETVTGFWNGIPFQVTFQNRDNTGPNGTELVIWLNPEGLHLRDRWWSTGHKTIHGVTETQWVEIKEAVAACNMAALEVKS